MNRIVAVGALALTVCLIVGPSLAAGNEAAVGQEIYKRANCVGCHKWHGSGGGGYGGAALSLRKTQLDKDQIATTVKCGRPGTGMPYFGRDSYPTNKSEPATCYGMTRDDLGKTPLAQGGTFLKPEEVEAVAEYVVHQVKGKGEPNLADCVAFYGEQSSACDVYKAGHQHVMPTPSTTQ